MPIYVYRCKQCGEEFEKLVLSSARASETTCPNCQSSEIEKRPTLFGLGGTNLGATAADSSCAPAVGGG